MIYFTDFNTPVELMKMEKCLCSVLGKEQYFIKTARVLDRIYIIYLHTNFYFYHMFVYVIIFIHRVLMFWYLQKYQSIN